MLRSSNTNCLTFTEAFLELNRRYSAMHCGMAAAMGQHRSGSRHVGSSPVECMAKRSATRVGVKDPTPTYDPGERHSDSRCKVTHPQYHLLCPVDPCPEPSRIPSNLVCPWQAPHRYRGGLTRRRPRRPRASLLRPPALVNGSALARFRPERDARLGQLRAGGGPLSGRLQRLVQLQSRADARHGRHVLRDGECVAPAQATSRFRVGVRGRIRIRVRGNVRARCEVGVREPAHAVLR